MTPMESSGAGDGRGSQGALAVFSVSQIDRLTQHYLPDLLYIIEYDLFYMVQKLHERDICTHEEAQRVRGIEIRQGARRAARVLLDEVSRKSPEEVSALWDVLYTERHRYPSPLLGSILGEIQDRGPNIVKEMLIDEHGLQLPAELKDFQRRHKEALLQESCPGSPQDRGELQNGAWAGGRGADPAGGPAKPSPGPGPAAGPRLPAARGAGAGRGLTETGEGEGPAVSSAGAWGLGRSPRTVALQGAPGAGTSGLLAGWCGAGPRAACGSGSPSSSTSRWPPAGQGGRSRPASGPAGLSPPPPGRAAAPDPDQARTGSSSCSTGPTAWRRDRPPRAPTPRRSSA
ncbi:circumsporozoite protein-like [Heterodontus francisci]|uniref:circumsporozoite protein-like n=1 Tax=Heterodontus francisci TaxID=7792 RepID=UPI00355BC6F9